MKRRFEGKIEYTIDKNHPDYDCCPVDERDGILTYSDTYTMDENYFLDRDEMIHYIEADLLCVACGGHSTACAHNVKYEITEV